MTVNYAAGYFFGGLFISLVMGCGGGPSKYTISGEAVFNEQPIPRGEIIFTPRSSAGSAGLQGRAIIEDGKFSTAQGLDCLPGDYSIELRGSDGVPFQDVEQMIEEGKPLFPVLKGEIQVPDGDLRLKLDVTTDDGTTHLNIEAY